MYSGASPHTLVEHCVTFRHDRTLLSLLGFVHNWPTSRWSATKKTKKNRLLLNGNGIVSSFLGRQFYRSTLYIYIYIYVHHHHHHHVVPQARISLTFSRHFSLSFIAFGRSSGLYPVSSHNCWMYVRAGRSAFARPYVGWGFIGVLITR